MLLERSLQILFLAQFFLNQKQQPWQPQTVTPLQSHNCTFSLQARVLLGLPLLKDASDKGFLLRFLRETNIVLQGLKAGRSHCTGA
jgi:hypothetical protein